MTVIDTRPETREDALRERAVKRLKDRKDFHMHLLIFVLFNSFLITIWAVTMPGGFFWPMFPLMGWGIGLVANAWEVYRDDEVTEEQIQQEMTRLAGRR